MPNPVTGRIGVTELPGSIFGRGGLRVQSYDLENGLLAGSSSGGPPAIAQGAITPDQIGLPVKNATGLTINAGRLVYVSGWDAGAGVSLISPATAADVGSRAEWVLLSTLANNASGTAGRHFSLTGQNTSAGNVGDPVYLNLLGNGGYSLVNPGGVAQIYQIVGRIAVKDASVGVVDLDLLSGAEFLWTTRVGVSLPQIGTAAGPYYSYISAPENGTILSASAVFPGALGLSGANYVQISIANLFSGGGSTAVTSGAALPVNSTFTGGTAIVQDQAFPLVLNTTPANLQVSQGDQLKCLVTVVGTLGAAIPAGAVISVGLLVL